MKTTQQLALALAIAALQEHATRLALDSLNAELDVANDRAYPARLRASLGDEHQAALAAWFEASNARDDAQVALEASGPAGRAVTEKIVADAFANLHFEEDEITL